MRQTRVPLWLICDPKAALRLWVAIGMLWLGCRRYLRKARPPSPEGIIWITVYLGVCEVLLRWAITRRALALNGLSPALARIRAPTEARDSEVWRRRLRTFVRMAETIDRHARRLAGRMTEALAAPPSALDAEDKERRSPIFLPSNVETPALFKRGATIRAPPLIATGGASLPVALRAARKRERAPISA